MSPSMARDVLLSSLSDEIPEERPNPPAWEPFTSHHRPREVTAAASAAHSRREHIRRLAALSDLQLARMLAAGWDPRDRGHYPELDVAAAS